jgi:uncharacterized membrane protein YgcG
LATLALAIDGTAAQGGATSPLNYSWDTTTVSNGAHTLLATATDTDGAAASLPVTVTVKNNPTVAITSPVGGATVSGSVPITANATVPGGTTLTSLVISIDGTQVLTGAASPATFSWDTTALADGSSHTLSVVATDADTGTANTSITVTVSNTPTSVAVTAPANNATVSGSTTVIVKATVGNGITVTNLLLAIDGRQVQTAAASTLSFTWDTTQVANGSHTLAANVTDSKGTSASSTAVTVTVANNTQGGGDGGSGSGADGGSHGGGSNGGCGCGATGAAPAVGFLCSLLAWAGARRRRR